MNLQAFVPLVTYPEPNADAIAGHAALLAADVGAEIHALAINADLHDGANALSKLLLDAGNILEAEAGSRRRGEHLLAEVREKASWSGVDGTAKAVPAPVAALGDIAATHARYFDLSLIGWEAGNATSRMAAEAVIFGSGRPAVLLPELWAASPIDHVAIAWDGSRVAARAVADAQIFLERAALVSVITVLGEKPLRDHAAGERLAEGLRRRGFRAEAMAVDAEDLPIGKTLQRSAVRAGCKLLVMGGYGHSRMRDFVLGGATRDVLADLLLPVLFSH
jgi:nucleotide-binding universal stress UspA family protein